MSMITPLRRAYSPTAVLAAGNYELCVSVNNGAVYAGQAVTLEVKGATNAAVSTIAPRVVLSSAATSATLTVAAASAALSPR